MKKMFSTKLGNAMSGKKAKKTVCFLTGNRRQMQAVCFTFFLFLGVCSSGFAIQPQISSSVLHTWCGTLAPKKWSEPQPYQLIFVSDEKKQVEGIPPLHDFFTDADFDVKGIFLTPLLPLDPNQSMATIKPSLVKELLAVRKQTTIRYYSLSSHSEEPLYLDAYTIKDPDHPDPISDYTEVTSFPFHFYSYMKNKHSLVYLKTTLSDHGDLLESRSFNVRPVKIWFKTVIDQGNSQQALFFIVHEHTLYFFQVFKMKPASFVKHFSMIQERIVSEERYLNRLLKISDHYRQTLRDVLTPKKW